MNIFYKDGEIATRNLSPGLESMMKDSFKMEMKSTESGIQEDPN